MKYFFCLLLCEDVIYNIIVCNLFSICFLQHTHSDFEERIYSMKNILLRMAAFLIICALMLGSLCGCSKEEIDLRPALKIWVYTDEYKESIERSFCADMPSLLWRAEISVVPVSELSERLEAAQEDGTMPDIFMLSPDNLSYYTDSKLTADLSSLGFEPNDSLYYSYTTQMSTDSQGTLKALCWQPDPGLFFYRRTLAKAYLGTDEPAEIQKMVGSWDSFIETARTLRDKSQGKTRMLAGAGELTMPYLFSDEEGWIDGSGKFAMSSRAESLMDYAALMHSEGLIYEAEQWSPAWIAGMEDPQSVFGYFSSGIGMEAILRKACGGTIDGEGSFGDWAAVTGPSGYNWGGCWFAVSESSNHKRYASVFLEYIFSETEAMKKNCLVSGSFSPSRTVVEQIKYDPQFSDSFLSGQNYYVQMAAAANGTVCGKQTRYDAVIDGLFTVCAESYAYGRKTRNQAIDDLYSAVQANYPELF